MYIRNLVLILLIEIKIIYEYFTWSRTRCSKPPVYGCLFLIIRITMLKIYSHTHSELSETCLDEYYHVNDKMGMH